VNRRGGDAGYVLCAGALGVMLLSACAAPAAPAAGIDTPTVSASTAAPTITPSPTADDTPTSAPTLTETATASPTPTPVPTLAPDAITLATAPLIEQVMALGGGEGAVLGVAVSGDGGLIASAGADRVVRVFDGRTGDPLHEFERHDDIVYDVALSADGSRLVSGGRDRTVQVWNPLTGERVGGARTPGEIAQVAFSPDGARFAGAGFYSALGQVWSAADAAPLFELQGHATRLRSVAWGPDGGRVATGDEAGVVVMHDAATGEAVAQFEAVTGEATALAFSPDGGVLAVGSSRGEVALWRLGADERDAGERDAFWPPHSGAITALAFSPDGGLLITAGRDGAVRLWDAAALSGVAGRADLAMRAASLNGHGAAVRDAAISADGATLVSGGDDGRVLVWRVGLSEGD
jgi:WD40 repeat protein